MLSAIWRKVISIAAYSPLTLPILPPIDGLLQHGDLLLRELPLVLRRLLGASGRPVHRLSSPKGVEPPRRRLRLLLRGGSGEWQRLLQVQQAEELLPGIDVGLCRQPQEQELPRRGHHRVLVKVRERPLALVGV